GRATGADPAAGRGAGAGAAGRAAGMGGRAAAAGVTGRATGARAAGGVAEAAFLRALLAGAAFLAAPLRADFFLPAALRPEGLRAAGRAVLRLAAFLREPFLTLFLPLRLRPPTAA